MDLFKKKSTKKVVKKVEKVKEVIEPESTEIRERKFFIKDKEYVAKLSRNNEWIVNVDQYPPTQLLFPKDATDERIENRIKAYLGTKLTVRPGSIANLKQSVDEYKSRKVDTGLNEVHLPYGMRIL